MHRHRIVVFSFLLVSLATLQGYPVLGVFLPVFRQVSPINND
jgi:hypothetical protein